MALLHLMNWERQRRLAILTSGLGHSVSVILSVLPNRDPEARLLSLPTYFYIGAVSPRMPDSIASLATQGQSSFGASHGQLIDQATQKVIVVSLCVRLLICEHIVKVNG